MSIPAHSLVQFLRENLRLTGTHVGCDTSQCGACVVHLNGIAVKSCTTLALQAEGANDHDHRRSGSSRWPAASDAGGVPRAPWLAVRLLHARHDHDGGRYCPAQGQRARRADDPRASSRATSAVAPATTTSSKRSRPAPRAMKDCTGCVDCRSSARGGSRHELVQRL